MADSITREEAIRRVARWHHEQQEDNDYTFEQCPGRPVHEIAAGDILDLIGWPHNAEGMRQAIEDPNVGFLAQLRHCHDDRTALKHRLRLLEASAQGVVDFYAGFHGGVIGSLRDLLSKASTAGFDPLTAETATDAYEAMEIARAWADGRRTWMGTDIESIGLDGIAVMDAQEVVKWAALASAMLAVEAE